MYLYLLIIAAVLALCNRASKEKARVYWKTLKKHLYYFIFSDIEKSHWSVIYKYEKSIICAVQEFQKAISLQAYFDRQSLNKWKSTNLNISLEITFDYEFLLREHKSLKIFQEFFKYVNQCEAIRIDYNKRFIEKALKDNEKFFDVIEKNPLTRRQREAIVIDDDRNLVIAGAGTGKTSTLVGKCAYVIDKLKVDPSKILLLAFNTDAVEELKVRMQLRCKEALKRDVVLNVSTFHGFGYQIIKEFDRYDKGAIVQNKEEVIRDLLYARIKNDEYIKKLVEYFIRYHVYVKDFLDIGSFEEYEEYKQESKSLNTICGERVDSTEERDIADFFFRNRIKYVWNKEYKVNTVTERYKRQYQPDFYLPEYDIYIEHWGVGEPDISGRYTVPSWFKGNHEMSARDLYLEGMAWKKELHEKSGTKLIETFSYEKKKGVLFVNLKDKLLKSGIPLNPMSPDELLKHILDNLPQRFENFFELVISLLSIMKSNLIDLNEVKKRFELNYSSERMNLFLELFGDLYYDYQKYLSNNKKLDFDDMIAKGVRYLEANPALRKFDYVLVDEFQDMSHGRYKLLNAVLKNNPDCKLFAVGDDWQSIYRFTGSDISIITEFKKYFGPFEQTQLDKTFRYNDQILNVSREFIQQNSSQLQKNDLTTGIKASERAVNIIQKKQSGEGLLRHLSKEIDSSMGAMSKKGSLFILNRRRDPYSKDFDKDKFIEPFKNIDIKFKTVHSSKGLEADFVIIDNVEVPIFPSETITDEILRYVLPTKEDFLFAEERRLFYVALTRAKDRVYILGQGEKVSGFFKEVEEIERSVYLRACKKLDDKSDQALINAN